MNTKQVVDEPSKNEKLAIDLAEVPSAKWGWSAQTTRTYRIVAIVMIIGLLLLLKGNHRGHIEDCYLISIAAIIGIFLGRNIYLSRKRK